jgi:hypothetical protein
MSDAAKNKIYRLYSETYINLSIMQKKNHLVYFLLLLMILCINGSCQVQTGKSQNEKSGNTTEIRDVSKFDGIDLTISANIYLKQGSPQSVKLEGNADDLAKVVTDVSGSELKIKSRPGSWNIHHVDVYITMENIENLTISGSGSIKSETLVSSNNLSLIVSGSGNINVPELTVKNVSSVISGSGNISYAGKSLAEDAKIVVTGSGNVNSNGLEVKKADVTITGSGDCNVYADEKLEVQITGSGSVTYKGKALIDANVTGSGKVHQSN